jgi:hypothetical protein
MSYLPSSSSLIALNATKERTIVKNRLISLSSKTTLRRLYVAVHSFTVWMCSISNRIRMAVKPEECANWLKSGIGSIARLLCHGSPAAVRRFVVSIYVNTIKAEFWSRLSAHICEKVGKCTPSFADDNAATSIMSPSYISWIKTALSHGSPRRPFWSTGTAIVNRFSMNHVVFGIFGKISLKAPAAFYVICSKGVAQDNA